MAVVEGRWELGSQVHWFEPSVMATGEPAPWSRGLLAGTGRDALRMALAAGRYRRLWMPTFMCQEVVRSAQRDAEVVAFPDSPLEAAPNLRTLPVQAGDAVFLVNYFGLRRQEDVPAVPSGVGVIEDHTHAPCSGWARASTADFCITSLRKIHPLPDGGALWSPRGHPLPSQPPVTLELEAASERRLGAMLLKGMYLRGASLEKSTFLELSASGEAQFDVGATSGMTAFSTTALRTLPLSAWDDIRAQNFARLAAGLSSAVDFQVLAPRSNDAPFGATLVFHDPRSRDRLRAALITKNIYPSALWPLDSPVIAGIPDEHRALASRMFWLPCDARYDARDIDRVIEAFRLLGALAPKAHPPHG